jgi:hypothetical protein
MCFQDASAPVIIPVAMEKTRTGTQLLTVSFLLGKVTTLRRNGEHISFRGMRYPIGQTIHDTKAIFGSHDFALHFAATPACTIGLPDEFGSHRLAVLPGPRVWDPMTKKEQAGRCWHSDSCTPVVCLECSKLNPEDLTNPDFWRACNTYYGRTDAFLRPISLDQIWHRQIVVSDTKPYGA